VGGEHSCWPTFCVWKFVGCGYETGDITIVWTASWTAT